MGLAGRSCAQALTQVNARHAFHPPFARALLRLGVQVGHGIGRLRERVCVRVLHESACACVCVGKRERTAPALELCVEEPGACDASAGSLSPFSVFLGVQAGSACACMGRCSCLAVRARVEQYRTCARRCLRAMHSATQCVLTRTWTSLPDADFSMVVGLSLKMQEHTHALTHTLPSPCLCVCDVCVLKVYGWVVVCSVCSHKLSRLNL